MEKELDLFYNTVPVEDTELEERKMKAGTQNKTILDFFRSHPSQEFTPFQVQYYCHLNHTPITSIRRSITTLTKLGYLRITPVKRMGEYGIMNNCWKLAG